MKSLSWKSNVKHAVLEHLIKEIDSSQDLSRSAITNRAVLAAEKTSAETWKKVNEERLKLPKLDVPIPTAMQVKIEDKNEKIEGRVEKNIMQALGLHTLQTQLEIQLLWMNYLNTLKVKALNVGDEKKSEDDLTGPEMVKRLVQILMLNRASDVHIIEAIKSQLLKWEE